MSNQYYKNQLAKKLKELTTLKEEEIEGLLTEIPIKISPKGSILLHQGDHPQASYYLIQGCVRQYAWDENGKEVTIHFYTEAEPINMFSYLDQNGDSRYSLSCLEDCYLVTCPDLEESPEEDQPEIADMKRIFFEKQFSDMQLNYMNFKLKSPEERFAWLLETHPQLLERIPQIYLASYLSITPETFSRFKKKHIQTQINQEK
jgi:CRP-like cAMP-binding protein